VAEWGAGGLKAGVARLGRDPKQVKTPPAVSGVVGETKPMAEDKLAYIEGLAPPLDSVVLLSEVLNFDFASRGMDEPFSDADMASLTGLQALRDRVVRMTGKANPTTRDFIEFSRRGTVRELPVLAGTPQNGAAAPAELFV